MVRFRALYAVGLLTVACSVPATAWVISNVNRGGYEVSYNGLEAGAKVYVDRDFTFTSGPAYLMGQTYIQTANNDKSSTGESFLTFTVSHNCTVYVAHDNTISPRPSWLNTFTNTGDAVITTDGGKSFGLFRKDFFAGSVVLGGNHGGGSSSMYSVAVIPTAFGGPPGLVTAPLPADGAVGVSRLVVPGWTAGTETASYDVYFGLANPPALIGNQGATSYNPGLLEAQTTYYWRVDAVNALGTTAGPVWSFTTGTTTAVSAWSMDDNAASPTVLDSVGGRHGTFYSGAYPQNTSLQHRLERVEGAGALAFDGIDDHVMLPRSTVLETGHAVTRQLSVSAWVKHDLSSSPGQHITIAGTGDGGWLLGSFPDDNNLVFACWLKNGGQEQLATVGVNRPVFDGQWHFVVGVFDGLKAHLYVDGEHAEISTIGGAIQNTYDKGVLVGENHQARGRYWQGLIDDVKIYDYALTAEDFFHWDNPRYAWKPYPVHGAIVASLDGSLSWSAGQGAMSYDVYFGTDPHAVAHAQRPTGDITGDGAVDLEDLAILAAQWLTDPGAVVYSADVAFSGRVDFEDFAGLAADWHTVPDAVFQGNTVGTVFDPGALEYSTTYYWRVDGVNSTDPQSPYTGRVWQFSRTAPIIKIMPLGDSITQASYRYYLWHLLMENGYVNIDFVGSHDVLAFGGYDNRNYDKDHEGHFGWTASQIAANTYGWLQQNPADIILLHIGTNGLTESPQYVESILNEIRRFEADYGTSIKVLLAKIINRMPNGSNAAQIAMTTTFNNNVAAMAQTRIANGEDIVIVDMENGAGFTYTTADMWDDKHPNEVGYQKMANLWFTTLQTVLP